MSWTQALLDLFGPPPSGPNRVPPPATAATSPAERVLALLRGAGGPWRRVVLTRNRRIMASVAGDGGELRLHESFADAPDDVLLALNHLFASRGGRRRAQARARVRDFIRAQPVEPRHPRERAPATTPSDQRHLERLQREFDRVNADRFAGELPRVPLHLSRRMRSRNGHFSVHPLEIVINRRLCSHGAPGEAEHTLRHEMVHLWQHATGRRVDHGADFRAMARRLDVHPRATRDVRWGR